MNLARLVVIYIGVAMLVATIAVQSNTIEQQRALIRDMVQNPQCLVPPKDPAFHN